MYVVIRNSDRTAHIFKDKKAAADFCGVSPFIFNKNMESWSNFGGEFNVYKASTYKNKSTRGGFRGTRT